jgi:hypothetical protein
MKMIASNSHSDLETIKIGNAISRPKKTKYLICDAKIQRLTAKLDRGDATVSEFLSVACNFSYNPRRHVGQNQAPVHGRPTLVARRRNAPAAQLPDSDSA